MSTNMRPQHDRARRVGIRWHWPVLLVLIAAGVLALRTWKHRAVATIRLPDGTAFSISELSNRSGYSWPPKRTDELIIDQVNRYTSKTSLPQLVSLWPTKGIGHGHVSSDGWLAIDWNPAPQSSPETLPRWIVITDSNGWRFLRAVPTGDKTKAEGTIVSLPQMPKKSRLQLELLTDKGQKVGETQFDWEQPPRSTGSTSPRSIPVTMPHTVTAGDLSVTLYQVKLIPALDDDIPDEIRLTRSSSASIRPEIEILWKNQRSADWSVFEDLRGDVSFFWMSHKPFCIFSPYGSMNLNLICICHNIEELPELDYVRFTAANLTDPRAAIPDSGKALVRLIATSVAGQELVADCDNVMVQKELTGRRSLSQIADNKAEGFVEIAVEPQRSAVFVKDSQVTVSPSQIHIELKSSRPVALFAAERDANMHRPLYCVLAHDGGGQRISGYQYNDSGTGLIFWFPRDGEACPAKLTFTVIQQTVPTIQFRIAFPESDLKRR